MINNVLEYKGYHAKIEFDAEGSTLIGKIDGINDLVTFQAMSADEIKLEFKNAVDDYLDFCKEVGKAPEKEYKGQFNVRVSPDIHRSLSKIAYSEGVSLNAVAEKAFKEFVHNRTKEEPAAEIRSEAFSQLFVALSTAAQNYTQSMASYNYSEELKYDYESV